MITDPTPIADYLLILPVVLPLIGAALLLLLRDRRVPHALIAMVVVLGMLVSEYLLLGRVLEAGPVSMTMGRWLPPFGISFTADVAGAGFALTAAFVTLLLLVYSLAGQRRGAAHEGAHALTLLLLAGVSGSFLTGDLFNLYVWFEVMLIASFGLLVLDGRNTAVDGAVKYGFPNFLATTLFLVALGLLYGLLGTLNMADIIRVAPSADPVAMTAIAALLLLAFGMKSAAFPVNGWLAASYHTPPAHVAALMAGLLTKVGVYALFRTMLALLPQSRDLLDPVITTIAVLTLVLGPLSAIAETNLRRALGFILIGGIGAALAGISLPSVAGVAGGGLYIFHAMLTMSALYLIAGLIEAVTGEIDSRKMGGLYGASSGLSILFFVMMLAAAGVPPLLGFWPKLLLLQAAFGRAGFAVPAGPDLWGVALIVALLLNAVLTLIAGTRLWAHIFWRQGSIGRTSEQHNTRLRRFTTGERTVALGATAVLAAAIIVVGLVPKTLFDASEVLARDMLDPARYVAATGLEATR